MNAPTVPTAAQVFRALTRPAKRAPAPADLEALEGATYIRVPHAGLQLAVWVWGSGPSVWLLHGWESRASHMADFVQPLVDSGCRVVALDAPAHGASEGDVTDAVDHGRAVLSLAEALGAPAATIGHSMGSAAALYAFNHGMKVQASIHLSGPASMERALHRIALAAGLDDASTAEVLRRIVEQAGAPLDVLDMEQHAAGLRHRSLIVHDPDDPEVPFAESAALARAWSGSVLVPVRGVGHRRILREPNVVQTAVAFLASAGIGRQDIRSTAP